jgi:thiamine-phosphate pyrophosphorylase
MYETSPAVERAHDAAVRSAEGGPAAVRLAHWVLALTEDEDGRPAAVLERAGVTLEPFREAIHRVADTTPHAPPPEVLYRTARERSIALRQDPLLTTDFLLLAVLIADTRFTDLIAQLGVTVSRIESLLRAIATEPIASPEPLTSALPEFVVTDAPEVSEAARIVDANLNRGREALRVLDDYSRFSLSDRVLTEQFKTVRHRLAEATNLLSAATLLAARDTPNDVGTEITVSSEYTRGSAGQVAAVNLKRLQESLRSAEEFGKVLSGDFARAVEAIRYETYTLERAILRGGDARTRLADARLYVLLTGSQCTAALDWTIQQAAEGGADVFQLREKTLTDRELIDRATRMRKWTRDAGVLFVMNDRPDIAKLVGADGVHLGQDDLPVAAARRIVGPDVLIGVSTHNIEQVRRAVLDGADYLGVGPTFPSNTKSFDHFPGLEFVHEAAAETSLPAFALGGIGLGNVAEVVKAGARRIAVSSAIATANDPQAAAAALKRALGEPRPPGSGDRGVGAVAPTLD